MTKPAHDANPSWAGFLLAALVAALVMILGAGTASAVTAFAAQTRVGAHTPVAQILVGLDGGVGAGQRLGNHHLAYDFALATGVAAKTGLRMGGSSTVGGMDKAMQAMMKYSAKNPEGGMYDVIGHGSPNAIAGRSAAEVGDRIGAASEGQDIRLLSCRTGCPTGSFAQDLANNLGVRVKAPTADIGASSRGNTLDMFGGGWRWFSPQG
jgi:hypothetical protein